MKQNHTERKTMKTKNIQSGMLALLVAAGTTLSIHAQNNGPIAPPIPGGGNPPDAAEQVEREHARPATDFDADGDGTITSAELMHAGEIMLAEMQARFLEKYDRASEGQESGDGIISPDESLSVHQAQAEEWLNHVLERFDTDADGTISPNDQQPRGNRRRGLPLAALDTDADGTVSGAELVAAAAQMAANLQDRFLAHLDSIADGETAGDGIITAEESRAVHEDRVIHRIESFLARYYLNEDGNVTADELEAAHATKRHDRNRSRGNR